MKKQVMPFFAALALLTACDPDKETATPAPETNGVFVLSEGQFGAGDGAVSIFDKATKALTVDAFGSANSGAKLGDVVQSMGVQGTRGYIVVNASNKIEVVDLPGFKTAGTISGIEQPRYFTSTSATRGYVTGWKGPFTNYLPGTLSIINLATNTVSSTVTVGRNPEQLLALGGKIYVPNSLDNTVTVVDEASGAVSSTITVADGPSSMVADKDGNIWVLCSGFVTYGPAPNYDLTRLSNGALMRFNPALPATQPSLVSPARQSQASCASTPPKTSCSTASAAPNTGCLRHGHGPAHHAFHPAQLLRLCHRPA